ncbi:NH(3)-dependent NAD(+) synthetase OS=Streptomyces tendae OX=1932 GN=nadE PE=3 SV=1 [Streptomyces tendae]
MSEPASITLQKEIARELEVAETFDAEQASSTTVAFHRVG